MVFPSSPLFTGLGAYDVANHVTLWLVWHKKAQASLPALFRYDVFIHSVSQAGIAIGGIRDQLDAIGITA